MRTRKKSNQPESEERHAPVCASSVMSSWEYHHPITVNCQNQGKCSGTCVGVTGQGNQSVFIDPDGNGSSSNGLMQVLLSVYSRLAADIEVFPAGQDIVDCWESIIHGKALPSGRLVESGMFWERRLGNRIDQ